MDSFYNSVDLKCPFCLHSLFDSNPGQKICPGCQAEFEVDDRGECVFVNPDNRCGYCGAEFSLSVRASRVFH
jgi:predicted amidophosphoribosyltransferase